MRGDGRREAADEQLAVEEDGGDLGALEQVAAGRRWPGRAPRSCAVSSLLTVCSSSLTDCSSSFEVSSSSLVDCSSSLTETSSSFADFSSSSAVSYSSIIDCSRSRVSRSSRSSCVRPASAAAASRRLRGRLAPAPAALRSSKSTRNSGSPSRSRQRLDRELTIGCDPLVSSTSNRGAGRPRRPVSTASCSDGPQLQPQALAGHAPAAAGSGCRPRPRDICRSGRK